MIMLSDPVCWRSMSLCEYKLLLNLAERAERVQNRDLLLKF